MIKTTAKIFLKKYRENKSKQLFFKMLGHKPEAHYQFLTSFTGNIKELQKIKDFSLKPYDGEWICHIEGLDFFINSGEELFILSEVFTNGSYNIKTNKPFTFIDIGMNVGITSLFFANQELCKKVVAFEPFQPTLKMAKKNLQKNNKVSSKIELHEIGLGYPTRTLTVDYSEDHKGNAGIFGVPSQLMTKNGHKEKLPITDVFEALKDIDDENIILKIDCEGGEYEILERLNATRLLSRFSIIMIEWHFKGPAELKTILLSNGFELLSFGDHDSTGMLYAFRRI